MAFQLKTVRRNRAEVAWAALGLVCPFGSGAARDDAFQFMAPTNVGF
jgi:hypothetical protein